MKFETSGEVLGKVLPKMIEKARRMSITTVGGNKFDVYEPISLANDHLTFSTSLQATDTVAIRWEAIAAIQVVNLN